MSWLGGTIIIPDDSKKSIQEAYYSITCRIRHEADLEEFPNMCGHLSIERESDKIFDSFEEAEDYSNKIYSKWARKKNILLAFREEGKETKKIKDLKKRIESELEKKEQYYEAHKPRNFKSSYLGCPSCGSKVNKNHIVNYCCPVCGSDLKSETVKKTLDRYDEKVKKLKLDIKQEERKQTRKVKYAVFFCEYVG